MGTPSQTDAAAPGAWRGTLLDAAGKLAGAVATTAGFLTLLAATGGAVTWVRFHYAQLPADQGLRLIPREDLVEIGAVRLGLFAILGLIAVLGAYVIDPPGRVMRGTRVGLTALVAAEIVVAIFYFHHGDSAPKLAAAAVTTALALTGMGLMWWPRSARRLTRRQRVRPTLRRLREARAYRELGYDVPAPGRDCLRKLKPATVVAMAIVELALAVGMRLWLHDPTVAFGVLLAAGLTGICFAVAQTTGEAFWPYGVSVFFSVLVFGAMLTTVQIARNPRLAPVALLRDDGHHLQGVVGLLIAHGSDRWWLGTVTIGCSGRALRDSGRVFSVPAKEVVDQEIGTGSELRDAERRATALLRELEQRQPAAERSRGRPDRPAIGAVLTRPWRCAAGRERATPRPRASRRAARPAATRAP